MPNSFDDLPEREEADFHPMEPGRFELPSEAGAPARGRAPYGSVRVSRSRPVPPAVMDESEGRRVASLDNDAGLPENLLVGRNPIREAIKAGRGIEKLLVMKGDLSGSAREIVAKARDAGIVVQEVDRARLDAIYKNHQGIMAFASAAKYAEMADIFELAEEKGEPPLVVVLDGITDPHNLGAIIRSAECCGAHGVILPERRSAGLTPAAVKAAAGAEEYVKVVKVVNLSRALEELKGRGLWVAAATPDGDDAFSAQLTGPLALVIGSEGDGISDLVLKHCDRKLGLPMAGKIGSLNASVAAGVMLYAAMRARRG